MTGLIWKPVAIGMAVALMVGVPGAYLKGRGDGRAAHLAANFKALQTQLDERNDTDFVVETLDDSGLCAAIGGVYSNGQCN